MSVTAAIISSVVGGLIIALAVVLVRFNLKRLRIARIAAIAGDGELEQIYHLLEQTVGAKSRGCVFGRTNRAASGERNIIWLPSSIESFPWCGRSVEITTSPEVTFRFTEDAVRETQITGKVYRPVRVPHAKTSSGKSRIMYSPRGYVRSSKALRSALRKFYADSPDQFLSYLLCVGRDSYEFEPIAQARIGAPPAWVQSPEWPLCEQCKRKMSMILQIPGALLSSRYAEEVFYWFGCKRHVESTKLIEQFA
jgi:hypothetical protein